MTALRHPHIDPPLVIEVEADRLDEHLAAGWLPASDEEEKPSTPATRKRGASTTSEEEK